jgi:hypothetical protein
MTLSDALDKMVEFVRPVIGRRILGQAHVPLLALMPSNSSDAGTTRGGQQQTGSRVVLP